jgi:hypothetical protein
MKSNMLLAAYVLVNSWASSGPFVTGATDDCITALDSFLNTATPTHDDVHAHLDLAVAQYCNITNPNDICNVSQISKMEVDITYDYLLVLNETNLAELKKACEDNGAKLCFVTSSLTVDSLEVNGTVHPIYNHYRLNDPECFPVVCTGDEVAQLTADPLYDDVLFHGGFHEVLDYLHINHVNITCP